VPEIDKSLVWGFDRPHRIGSICKEPCGQCGAFRIARGANNEWLDSVPPMLILGVATCEDHMASNRRRGGPGTKWTYPYFYFVYGWLF